MRAGKIAGTQLKINNWFFVILLFFAAAGMVAKVLAVFAAILLHELGHVLAARFLAYPIREIELHPFGGVARIDHFAEAPLGHELMIASAGPAVSLMLAAFCYFAAGQGMESEEWVLQYGNANLLLAGFNLLPALPLDGGRIFRACISGRTGYQRATVILVRLTQITSLMLILIVLGEFWREGTANLTLMAAAVFLILAVRTEQEAAAFRAVRVLARKKMELSTRGIMPTVHYTATGRAAAGEIIRLFRPEAYSVVLVVDKEFHLQGCLTETEIWEALPQRGLYARIGDFLHHSPE